MTRTNGWRTPHPDHWKRRAVHFESIVSETLVSADRKETGSMHDNHVRDGDLVKKPGETQTPPR